MTNGKWLAALALAGVLALSTASAEGGLAMLGVQVKDTPAPAASETPAVRSTPDEQAAQAQDALMAAITPEEMEAAGLGTRILMRGMEGEDVRLLQRRLYQLGYYLGDMDGVFGLGTRTAVYGFQRVHKLEKVDGKIGPETIRRLFGEDVIIRPTPTPSPTPTPTPTPVPTPTPKPTPAPSATPCTEGMPFALETAEAVIGGRQAQLAIGHLESGEALYPLCGVAGWLQYEAACEAGTWQLVRAEDGAEIVLMTDGQNGLCEGAMGAANGVIFLADDAARVYVCGSELYVTEAVLAYAGISVQDAQGTLTIGE